MKLLVTAPMYWRTETEAYTKCWLYLKSMVKAGVPNEDFQPYGIGRPYCGSSAMRQTGQIEHLKSQTGYTHVLFSDAWDVLFTGPYQEILDKYEAIGRPPMLMAAGKRQGGIFNLMGRGEPYFQYFDLGLPYPFPSSFHMGEIPFIIDRLEQMMSANPGTHDEGIAYAEGFKNGLFHQSMLDTGCQIFQEKGHLLEMRNNRLYNAATNSYPCVSHMADGWTSQETGKDHIVEPWARQLGVL